MYRTVKQARFALNFFVEHTYKNKQPKAINSQKFIQCIASETNWNVNIRKTSNMGHLRGMILKKDSTKQALILISDKNNKCWSRFTAIKESCHLFLQYENQVNCDNALEMAQALVLRTIHTPGFLPANEDEKIITSKALLNQINSTIVKEGYGSINLESIFRKEQYEAHESAAVVAATEIMIPTYHRKLLVNISKTNTLNNMARLFRVPELILEYRLNEWGIVANK